MDFFEGTEEEFYEAIIIEMLSEMTGLEPETLSKDFEKFHQAAEKLIDKGYSEKEAMDILETIWEFPV